MKRLLFFVVITVLAFFSVQSVTRAQADLPDSVIFQGFRFDVGQTFRTATATTFGHASNNSYFKEANGTEHLAYVDNYKLYYFKSTDNGVTWSKEQITTGHEGDIYVSALTVDTAGKVFIGMTVHDLFNYANPSGITSSTQYFLYDAYCVNNKTGSWVTELVSLHEAGNAGPIVMGLFVDASNNVHLVANRYGWWSYGGIAWEWVRNSTSNTWGTTRTILEFNDAGVDRFINNTYTMVPDQQGNVTLLMCRVLPSTSTRLFYVRHNGTSWLSPVNITDTVAVGWNRFDALVDPAGHTYIAYLANGSGGTPEMKVIKDFQSPQSASFDLAPNDTIYYFRLHCNAEGMFTIYLTMKNQNIHMSFSSDAIHWSDLVESPSYLKNYIGGVVVRTDTRKGYFTDYAEHIALVGGPRVAMPYGPDTLFYGSIRVLAIPSTPALISPPNSGVVDSASVLFSWGDALPEVTHYAFEIDTTSAFTTSFLDSTITTTNYRYSQIVTNKTYYWRVKAKNQRCWGEFGGPYSFSSAIVSVGGEKGLPTQFALEQNYPDPFNPATTINYHLPRQSQVTIKVFDLLGGEVATLVNETKQAGEYNVVWDAGNMPSGVYFYRLQTESFSDIKKMVLVK